MTFQLIDNERAHHAVSRLCSVLNVSRQGYSEIVSTIPLGRAADPTKSPRQSCSSPPTRRATSMEPSSRSTGAASPSKLDGVRLDDEYVGDPGDADAATTHPAAALLELSPHPAAPDETSARTACTGEALEPVPCRRSWVRVPSSASNKDPLGWGFCFRGRPGNLRFADRTGLAHPAPPCGMRYSRSGSDGYR
jgi:hypothetical protein